MGDVLDIPLHLAAHVSGLAVAAGLVAYAAVRRWRLGAMWLALAVGGILIGTSHVLAGALVADGTALVLYLRAAGYAAIAVAAVGGFSGGVAAVVAVPIATHVVTAAAGGLASLATLGGRLGRGRAIAGLSAGLALWAVADLLASARPTAAAVVSLAGSVVALTWLGRQSRETLATRFVAAFGAVLLLVVVVLASAAAFVFDRDLRGDRVDLLQRQVDARAVAFTEDIPQKLADDLSILDLSATVAGQLGAGAADDALAADIANSVVRDADLLLLVGADGRVVGSFDRSTGAAIGTSETTLAGAAPVTAAEQSAAPRAGLVRLELAATETDAAELLGMAARPVFRQVGGQVRRDLPAGTVVAAQRLTRRDRLGEISAQTGAEVAVLADGRLAGATTGQDPALDTDLQALRGGTGGEVVDLADRPSFVAAAPLVDVSGTPVGTLILFEDATVVAGIEDTVTTVLFLAAVLGGLLATVLAASVTARTTRPVRALTAAADRIAAGDLTVRVPAGRDDEVGRLAAAFDHMVHEVRDREEDLIAAAEREVGLRNRLEAVMGAMTEALVAVDAAGLVVTANPAARQLLERGEGGLVGAPLGDVLHGVTVDGGDLAEALGRPGDPVLAVRGQVALRSGRRDVAATAAPLPQDEGEGRVFVFRDVTSEAEIDRMKTEFLANASHELNTPLTPILGFADTLARHPDLPAETRTELVEGLQESAQRLARIVAMLVDFAELESGTAHVRPEPHDLSAVVDEALERWRSRHPERTYRRRVRRSLPPVLLDRGYTGRVLDELLDNATKFSEGPILVAGRPDGGRVRLEVRDRGIGIDEASLEEVRADFRQVDGSATRHYGGLGLGLAIVERILARQDGELEITSEVGQGTHVAVLLPTASS